MKKTKKIKTRNIAFSERGHKLLFEAAGVQNLGTGKKGIGFAERCSLLGLELLEKRQVIEPKAPFGAIGIKGEFYENCNSKTI